MAKFLVKTLGLENMVIELRLGVNHLGRSPENDIAIPHTTISRHHCDIELSDAGVTIRDLESSNGTFVDEIPVRETTILNAGQVVRVGDVEMLVESTDLTVAIPKFVNTDLPAPPVVTANGAMLCPRHPQATVTHKCTFCLEVMCAACVHRLRRKGSKNILLLCPVCSKAVVAIDDDGSGKKKKSIFARVGETVRMKFSLTGRTPTQP
jgi:FHA domain